jgi:hypothetical protein
MMHADETYESAYGWSYEGQRAPDYGAFAETYSGPCDVHAIILDLTALVWYSDPLDAYVWADDGGIPGPVTAVVPNIDPGTVALWPNVSRHRIELDGTLGVEPAWWAGYWGRWPGELVSYFIAADLDGPGGGRPMTKIAPGLEWPSGWQDVAVRWFPTAALGIGAEVSDSPTTVRGTSWGAVKALFD